MPRSPLVLLLAFAMAAPASAQFEVIDQGNLSIRIADAEVGREQFTLIAGRRGGLPGSGLRGIASYPAVRPKNRFTGILERSGQQSLATFQVEVAGTTPSRTVAELARERLTVRSASGQNEFAREYPGGPDLVALDDSVYSYWIAVTDLATESGASLRFIYPRTGVRGRFVARREQVSGGPSTITMTGDIEGRILLDESGRFSGLVLPARRIEVLRMSDQVERRN
jgi:hypothetical protein